MASRGESRAHLVEAFWILVIIGSCFQATVAQNADRSARSVANDTYKSWTITVAVLAAVTLVAIIILSVFLFTGHATEKRHASDRRGRERGRKVAGSSMHNGEVTGIYKTDGGRNGFLIPIHSVPQRAGTYHQDPTTGGRQPQHRPSRPEYGGDLSLGVRPLFDSQGGGELTSRYRYQSDIQEFEENRNGVFNPEFLRSLDEYMHTAVPSPLDQSNPYLPPYASQQSALVGRGGSSGRGPVQVAVGAAIDETGAVRPSPSLYSESTRATRNVSYNPLAVAHDSTTPLVLY